MNNYRYRTCCECGKKWNVSIHNSDKKYLCPLCRPKRGDKHDTGRDQSVR